MPLQGIMQPISLLKRITERKLLKKIYIKIESNKITIFRIKIKIKA